MTNAIKVQACDMDTACADPIAYLDDKGFVYCTKHGIQRKAYQRCRKLRPHEIKRIERGETLTRY